MCQSPSVGPDVNKQLCAFLRRLADDLERENHELRSTAMKRDFISNRLPPYLLDQADVDPGESHGLVVAVFVDVPLMSVPNGFLFQLGNHHR